ncbi:MAG TPA: hypothetical protein VGO59_17150 [Verrucomicrobiae bacterium]|jgi:hypothetical protein
MRSKSLLLLPLALSSFVAVSAAQGSPYAAAVVNYNPGAGYAPGYTNVSAVIGQPASSGIDPFDPAYETNQILSIGAGGSVTVEFDRPIVHYPNGNRDFIIFGNSFLEAGNYFDPPDVWAANGEVINDGGATRVSVSADGVAFYTLNPALAPTVNDLYPTDGAGDFRKPVNPGLNPARFAGLTLSNISMFYDGSAGGASYNIAWAQDTNGNAADLRAIRYVRVDVLTNSAQVAGFAAVEGTALAEDFSNNPAADGWQAFGDANLFTWQPAGQEMHVTWDSTKPNSFYFHPLGTVLTSNDAFSLSFDLLLTGADTNEDGTNALELGIGFLNLAGAENPNFLIGTGENATNLAEFEFYPAAGEYGGLPSLDATLIDTNGYYYFAYDDIPWGFGMFYHVTITHAAGTSALTGQILANGQLYSTLPGGFSEGTGDFRLDAVSINSYSDAGTAALDFPSSITADGFVKNMFVTAPPPPVTYLSGAFTNNAWQAQFWSRTNWNYTLEKSANLQTWLSLGPAAAGTGGPLALQDTNTPGPSVFYRVSASPQ